MIFVIIFFKMYHKIGILKSFNPRNLISDYNCNCFSNILGGANNTMSGMYSSILGGSGNNDNGFNYAGVFGQNIVAVAPNTFHVECLNAVNTPCWPGFGTYPSCTVVKIGTSNTFSNSSIAIICLVIKKYIQ